MIEKERIRSKEGVVTNHRNGNHKIHQIYHGYQQKTQIISAPQLRDFPVFLLRGISRGREAPKKHNEIKREATIEERDKQAKQRETTKNKDRHQKRLGTTSLYRKKNKTLYTGSRYVFTSMKDLVLTVEPCEIFVNKRLTNQHIVDS